MSSSSPAARVPFDSVAVRGSPQSSSPPSPPSSTSNMRNRLLEDPVNKPEGLRSNPLFLPLLLCSVVAVGLLVAVAVLAARTSSGSDAGGGGGGGGGAAVLKGPMTVVHITDIHYDPLYKPTASCTSFCRDTRLQASITSTICGSVDYTRTASSAPYGRRACDAPKALVDSLVQTLAGTNPNPGAIVVTGDIAAHMLCETPGAGFSDCDGSTAQSHTQQIDALTYVSDALRAAFPHTPILKLMGNNDSPQHYVTPLGPAGVPYMRQLMDIWGPGIRCDGCGLGSAYTVNTSTWDTGGYYAASLTHPSGSRTRFVILNTLLFYRTLPTLNLTRWGGYQAQRDAALTHLLWLGHQLQDASAAGDAVVLACHVPPGLNSFSSVLNLQPDLQQLLFQTLQPYTGTVSAVLGGHYHTDVMSLLRVGPQAGVPASGDGVIPLLAMSSITPVYQANPAFRTYALNDAGAIDDYTQHWLDLAAATAAAAAGASAPPTWQPLYQLSSAYGVPSFANRAALVALSNKFIVNGDAYRTYISNRLARQAPFQVHHGCMTQSSTPDELDQCKAAHHAADHFFVCYPHD